LVSHREKNANAKGVVGEGHKEIARALSSSSYDDPCDNKEHDPRCGAHAVRNSETPAGDPKDYEHSEYEKINQTITPS
jgi:hypothetical protein